MSRTFALTVLLTLLPVAAHAEHGQVHPTPGEVAERMAPCVGPRLESFALADDIGIEAYVTIRDWPFAVLRRADPTDPIASGPSVPHRVRWERVSAWADVEVRWSVADAAWPPLLMEMVIPRGSNDDLIRAALVECFDAAVGG